MKKSLLGIFFAVVVLLGLTGCESKDDYTKEDKSPNVEEDLKLYLNYAFDNNYTVNKYSDFKYDGQNVYGVDKSVTYYRYSFTFTDPNNRESTIKIENDYNNQVGLDYNVLQGIRDYYNKLFNEELSKYSSNSYLKNNINADIFVKYDDSSVRITDPNKGVKINKLTFYNLKDYNLSYDTIDAYIELNDSIKNVSNLYSLLQDTFSFAFKIEPNVKIYFHLHGENYESLKKVLEYKNKKFVWSDSTEK